MKILPLPSHALRPSRHELYQDKYRAAWVVPPNTYFDPKKGHELYNRYLDEFELAAGSA